MSIPSFIGVGVIASDTVGAGVITPTPPNHQLNDILIAAAQNQGGSSILATPADWTQIIAQNGTNDTAYYWTRASSAGISGPTLTSANTDIFGVVAAWRGAITTGTPYEAATLAGDQVTAQATPSTAGITTLNVNRRVINIGNIGDDTAWTTLPPPSGWVLSSIMSTSAGTDAQFTFIERTKADASSVLAASIGLISATELWNSLTFAMKPQATTAITGTITPNATEAEIVTGGKNLVITLTDDVWIAAGAASFDLQRQAIINGVTSAQNETLGWNLVPKALQSVNGVVRTSDTVVTITWDAFPTYDITATEIITVTIPATAVIEGNTLIATPTFSITPEVVGEITNNNLLLTLMVG